MLWVLVSVIVILGLAYWVTRRVAGGMALGRVGGVGPQKKFEVLGRLTIGRGQSLLVVRVDKRGFLLGMASGCISMLAELTEEELAYWKIRLDDRGQGKGEFRNVLQNIWRQKGQR